jgi:putative component of membrane protein insertase Oxa1/YidC/SpoIIIJ protein YidD
LCAIRQLEYALNRHYLARIYLIFIRPMSEYVCELWNGCSQQESDNLEKLQLEAGRIVTYLPLFVSRKSIYNETGWELVPVSDRRRVKKAQLILFYSQ